VSLARRARQLTAYSSARHEFVAGDLLCFRGRGLVSFGIRGLTRSEYSHAGLVYLFLDRVYCLEAVGHGVRLMLMSELVRYYDGGIDYFEVDAEPAARDDVVKFAFFQLGKRYDTWGIVRFLAMLATGRARRVGRDDRWFCSELVAAAYQTAGLPLVERGEAYTSPSDLVRSERVRYRYALKPA
jgi:uncharacterized protein YycO